MDHVVACWSARSIGVREIVIPDGCRDLVFVVYPRGSVLIKLTGLARRTFTVQQELGTRFLGIRFAPGSLAAWETGIAPSDQAISDRALVDHLSRMLLDDPGDGWSRVTQEAAALFRKPTSIVGDFLAALRESPGRIPSLGTSERTLRRNVGATTGASPQFWVSLFRARRAAQALLAADTPAAEVAFGTGYADQSHMTREIRRWFAVTPTELRNRRHRYSALFKMLSAFSNPALA